MNKSAEAFRTIGEVADELDVPKHVLRFWEGKFPHIRPMKRGGGRRYYRPEDMELLRGIRHLLHAEGYTIKGVQKILREQGIDQVKAAAIAAGAVLAAKSARGTKPRTRTQQKSQVQGNVAAAAAAKPDIAVAGFETKPASKVAPQGGKRALEGEAKSSIGSLKSIIAAAIRELEICREILISGGAKPAQPERPRMRAARS
jgi:DNA-binding transcriptional MerR regulator